MDHVEAGVVARAQLVQLGADRRFATDENQFSVGHAVNKGDCSGNRDLGAMVAAHAVNRDSEGHG